MGWLGENLAEIHAYAGLAAVTAGAWVEHGVGAALAVAGVGLLAFAHLIGRGRRVD